MDEWTRMRGSQIPAFGNWDYVNELPITQYFECARQAGLIRYSSSSGEYDYSHNCYNINNNNTTAAAAADLYSAEYARQPRTTAPPKQEQGKEKRAGGRRVREGSRKQAGNGKVFDESVTELPQAVKKKQHQVQYDATQPCRPPKAVDEDLYHIPPELLKRKRRLGFFTRCLVPLCVA